MRGVYLLAIASFVFFALAVTLDLGTLLWNSPEIDWTPYLTARSLAVDHDLAYTSIDSDRYFVELLQRPSRFTLIKKSILGPAGESRKYAAFYAPDLYVLFLLPFVGLFHFHGVLVFHAILMALIYLLGYSYYSISKTDDFLTSINTLLYYTLVPLPILFLLPSHHLFLFAAISAALFFGLKGRPLAAAIGLGIVAASQPWGLLFAFFIISCLQNDRKKLSIFIGSLIVSVSLAWGIEWLMYPPHATDARWVPDILDRPVAEVWNTLPAIDRSFITIPALQNLVDFIAGRTIGFIVYAFPAAALILSTIWLIRDRLVRKALALTLLFLLAICFAPPSCWHISTFANDFAVLLAALPFFIVPMVRPKTVFYTATIFSVFLTGPLLVNPVGAILNRTYYLQAAPYRFFPIELTLLGKTGLTSKPVYRMSSSNARVYFLNDSFYQERDFFWVRGGSTLEFLLEQEGTNVSAMKIQNGALENTVTVSTGKFRRKLHLNPGESSVIDLRVLARRKYARRLYLHGTIESQNGFVPKLLSRENPDYRYLGCQVYLK